MAFVSHQRRQADPKADAAVNLLEVPLDVLLDSLRVRLGPDTRISLLSQIRRRLRQGECTSACG
jgi:hypothetical protein